MCIPPGSGCDADIQTTSRLIRTCTYLDFVLGKHPY